MAKKKGKASAKQVNKAKTRIIDDKTFGLKNKKKSKKVQRFVNDVKKQVSDRMQKKYGKGGANGPLTYEQKQERKRKEQEAKMMADISTMIAKKKKEPEKKRLEGVPPDFIKAVLEQFYWKYCKDKVNRIPAIMEKYAGQYDKLEAGLKKQYKDKAPDMQALYDKWSADKKEELDILEQAASWDGLTDQEICIRIEKQRRQLDLSKCTPVTPESFKEWREKKLAEDKRIAEAREAEELAKAKASGKKVAVTGKALYQLDASIFQDDEDAADKDEVQHKEDREFSDDEGEGKKADAGVQDESLFVDDDDLPDSDED
mmetsp:Transcript_2976/g.4304  ORF Transcript_2976/g.4304 Transcript_2976/m.4304 type:complete len:315 (+) Transcript_2976:119-1063(+)|eukprot:CAMPEP_0184485796 /NCGR_PEP_ID=MMETSP0113_2-20130426/7389_1 /TAXON_ID=91329 /ORGANISM="Norrisiella sphaerica, Strain BC52" /LENGTH=314 /DNA_ID=CAMNT_0026867415 /DNA_START=87 /DNA_END=1031 /DNA_ORIENTATION=-